MALLDEVQGPAEDAGWREIVATDHLLRGRGRLLTGDLDSASRLLHRGVAVAEEAGLVPLALEGRVALAYLAAELGAEPSVDAEVLGDTGAATDHDRAATDHLAVIAGSIEVEEHRERLIRASQRRRADITGEPRG